MLNKKALHFFKNIFYDQRVSWHKKCFDIFMQRAQILDVGCGKGLFIQFSPERIIGIDGNLDSLHECAKSNYRVIESDILRLPFSERAFDGVYCADVIEHLNPEGARQLLMELSRVLKSNGLLVIASPLASNEFWDDPSHVRPYPPHSLFSYFIKDEFKGRTTQPSYKSLAYDMEFVKIAYRYAQFFRLPIHLYSDQSRRKILNLLKPSSLLFMAGNLLSRVGLNRLRPEGFVLVMRKI